MSQTIKKIKKIADSDYKYSVYANTMINELKKIEASNERDLFLSLHGIKYDSKYDFSRK